MKKFILSALIMALTITTIYSGVSFTNGLTHYASASTNVTVSEAMAFLPNSDVVMLFDFNRFLGTKLFNSLVNDPKSKKDFLDFEQKATTYGFNIRKIRSIAVGLNVNQSKPEDSKFCAVMTGGFDREKILSSIAANPDKVSVESEEYQGQTIYLLTDKQKQASKLASGSTNLNVKIDEKIAATFLNSQTVAIGTIEKVKDSIDVQNGKQQSVVSNQQINNYINTTNAGAIFRFAALIPDKQKVATSPSTGKKSKSLTNDDVASSSPNKSSGSDGQNSASPFGNADKLLQAIQGVYGSMDFATGFQLETTALIRSESEAKQISDALNGLLFLGKSALQGDPKQASLAKLLDTIVVSGGTKDVRLNIDVPEALLNEIIKTFSNKPNSNTSKTPKLTN